MDTADKYACMVYARKYNDVGLKKIMSDSITMILDRDPMFSN